MTMATPTGGVTPVVTPVGAEIPLVGGGSTDYTGGFGSSPFPKKKNKKKNKNK